MKKTASAAFVAALAIGGLIFFSRHHSGSDDAPRSISSQANSAGGLLSGPTANSNSGADAPPPVITSPAIDLKKPKTVGFSFENALLTDNALDVDKVEKLLQSKKFDAQLDAFESQTVTDTDAAALTTTYKSLLAQQFSTNKVQSNVGRLVCGVTTCIGKLSNGTEKEYARWAGIFFRDPKTPGYGFISTTIHGENGEIEHRFAFSTDPAANSLSVPIR